MKKGGGKNKGSSFERKICKELSLWWSGGKSDSIFYRTGGSGGRATKRGRKGQSTPNHCGDVGASDPSGGPLLRLFTIELKKGYSTSTLQDMLDAPPQKKGSKKPTRQVYHQWFDQAAESARHAGSIGWMIIVRRNKRQSLAIFENTSIVGCSPLLEFPKMELVYVEKHQAGQSVRGVVVVRLEDFLASFTPEFITKASGSKPEDYNG